MNRIARYAVAGHPVAHSLSPTIHAAFAAQTGETLVYERLLCPLDAFAATVEAFVAAGGRGLNVTLPFKRAAHALARRRSARAERAGACNTLRADADGLFGDNTDGAGLVRDLAVHAGVALEGCRVLVVGAGGAAAGILGPLAAAGAREVVVANRTPARAGALVALHAGVGGAALRAATLADCGEAYDVVVNATSSSVAGAPVPVDARVLRPGTLAIDLMYGPAAQPFLAWAEANGATGRDGLGMLVEQAAESFFLWRGVRPKTAPVLAALRARTDAARRAGPTEPAA